MKKMFLVVATILSMTASMMAYGQTVTTKGDIPCGEWISDREKAMANPRTNDQWPEITNLNKLMGFLSGLAIMDPIEKNDALKNADVKSMILWMDNYCRNNPLERVYKGGMKLYYELLSKR